MLTAFNRLEASRGLYRPTLCIRTDSGRPRSNVDGLVLNAVSDLTRVSLRGVRPMHCAKFSRLRAVDNGRGIKAMYYRY